MEREKLEAIWHEYVGCRKLFMDDELSVLNSMLEDEVVPSKVVYQLYLTSKWWKALRMKALRRDDFSCVKCGSTMFPQVDHKQYPGFGKETLDDVQTLCWHCHGTKSKRWDLHANRKLTKNVKLGGHQLFQVLRVKA